MNKPTLIGMTAIVTVIVAALIYVLLSPRNTPASSDERPTTPSSQELTNPTEPVAGSYRAYSPELIETTKGTKILFFHAPWCPQCRELDASIQKDGVPNDVTIFKVDYDSNQALRQKYGVTIQTTLVKIDDSGNKIKSYVSYDEPNVNAVKHELLP